MTSYIANRVGKHILKENAKNHFGTEDPYFDYITPHDLNGNPKKVKKTKKAAPPGITSDEAKILKKVTRRAYRLDNCFSVCGIRLGWSAIFGIIPGLGDVFDVFMAMMVYRTICQLDIPSTLKTKMMFNIILDFGIGLVPILGDVADAVFKANTRNAALLYGHLRDVGASRIKGGGEPDRASDGVISPRKGSANNGRVPATTSTQKPIVSPTANTQQHSSLTSPVANHGHADPHLNTQTTGTVDLDSNTGAHGLQSPPAAKVKSENKSGWLNRFKGSGATGAGAGAGGATVAANQAASTTAGPLPAKNGTTELEAGRRI